MGVVLQVLAIVGVTLIAGFVGIHAASDKEVRVAVVHRVAAATTQAAVAALVARGQSHAVILQGRRQRRAVSPEPAVERSRLHGLVGFGLLALVVEGLLGF